MMNPFGAGLHLDRASFDESLREQARLACVDVNSFRAVVKGRCASVRKDDAGWIVSVDTTKAPDQTQYRANWIIDASGRKASMAHKVCL